jgi:acid phosphatase family membrane protein YuiD
MRTDVQVLFTNVSWWSALAAWLVAQSVKLATNLIRTKRVDFAYLVSTGGMPSAHTALFSALATSIGINEGYNSGTFVLAIGVAFMVMFDASTVRRAAGQQARILNEIVDEISKTHRVPKRKLRELLGHTRLEVFVGFLVGVATAIAVNLIWVRMGW